MQRPCCIITTTIIKQETTEVRTLRVLCALISSVPSVVILYVIISISNLFLSCFLYPEQPFRDENFYFNSKICRATILGNMVMIATKIGNNIT
jgi:hypothetical protein